MSKLTEVIASMTDDEKSMLKEQWDGEPEPFTGQKITFFFPDKHNLRYVDVVGTVPNVGDRVYISTWISNHRMIENNRHYNEYRRWKVKSIDWSLRVGANLKEDLVGNISYHAEVQLVLEDWPLSMRIRRWWHRCKRQLTTARKHDTIPVEEKQRE